MGLFTLIGTTAAFVLLTAELVLDLAGVLRLKPGVRAMLAGLLLMNCATLARMIAGDLGWSHTALLAVDWIGDALMLTAVGVLIVGFRGMARGQRRAR